MSVVADCCSQRRIRRAAVRQFVIPADAGIRCPFLLPERVQSICYLSTRRNERAFAAWLAPCKEKLVFRPWRPHQYCKPGQGVDALDWPSTSPRLSEAERSSTRSQLGVLRLRRLGRRGAGHASPFSRLWSGKVACLSTPDLQELFSFLAAVWRVDFGRRLLALTIYVLYVLYLLLKPGGGVTPTARRSFELAEPYSTEFAPVPAPPLPQLQEPESRFLMCLPSSHR